jgi:ribosome-associated toxin RatA of RatAB toxin-antitoxin module
MRGPSPKFSVRQWTSWTRSIGVVFGLSIATNLFHTNLFHTQSFPPALAAETGLFSSVVDQLPASARATLRSGNAIVSGDQGRYVARVLVTGTSDTAWSVLTDYDNFPKFLPNIVSTKILETNGNQKVVEQVDSRQVFLFTITSQVDGDLQSISGYWQIEPIAPYQGATPNQVLITQVVEAQPKSGTPRETFYDIFKSSLSQTMLAVSREVSSREIASSTNKMPTSGMKPPSSRFQEEK